MNTANPPPAEHRDYWDLLPWLVNGRLNESDCRRVEAHLRQCGACRDECAAQRRIYEVVTADTTVEQMPMAGLNKLRQRIEGGDVGAAGAPSGSVSDETRLAPGRRRRALAIAASVCTVAAALAAAFHGQTQRRAELAPYYTVTAAAPQHATAVIRAVFAPTVTLSELQRLLEEAHLRIVSGPTEAGVYSLAMMGPQSVDWSLDTLRGQSIVRFAESIGPVPSPQP